MKSIAIALASSIGTACALGIALAGPRQVAVSKPAQPMQVKLEWVSSNPRKSETLIVAVDEGCRASVTQGPRVATVSPTLNADGTVTLTLGIRSPGDDFSTLVTIRLSETKVIKGVTQKNGKTATEEMLFVTPSRVE